MPRPPRAILIRMQMISRRDALASGMTDWDLQRQTAAGSLTRIGRGAYLSTSEALTSEELHRASALAAIRKLAPGSVLSHRTAAVLHDLPLWNADLSRIDVTRPGTTSRQTTRTNFFGLPLASDEVGEAAGVPVTSLGRTLRDLACLMPFEEAVVVGDAALRRGAELPFITGRRGAARARCSVAFMNGLSESAGESRSRVLFHRQGLPAPLLQRRIRGDGYLGRVDFLWPQFSLVGEFDGEEKYRGRFGDGADALVSEKYREDAIRAVGWQVVRWCWDDLDDPRRVLADLGRAFRRGRPHPAFAA